MSNTIKTYDAFARHILGCQDGSLHDAYKNYKPGTNTKGTSLALDHEDPQVQLWYSKLQLEIIKAKLETEQNESERQKLLAGLAKLRRVYRTKSIANFISIGITMLYGFMQGAAAAGFVLLFIDFEWAVTSNAAYFMLPIAGIFMLATSYINYAMVRREVTKLVLNIPKFFDRIRPIDSPKQTNKFDASAFVKTVIAVLLGGFFIYYGSHELMTAFIENGLHIENAILHDFFIYGIPAICAFLFVMIPEFCMNYNSIKKSRSIFGMFNIEKQANDLSRDLDIDWSCDQKLSGTQKATLQKQYKRDFILIFAGMMATGLVSLGELHSYLGGIPFTQGLPLAIGLIALGTLFSIPFYIERVKVGVEARAEQMREENKRIAGNKPALSTWERLTRTESGDKTPAFFAGMNINSVGQAIPAMIPMLATIYLFSSKGSFYKGLDLAHDFTPLFSSGAGYIVGISFVLIATVVLGYGAYRAAMIGSEEGKNPNYGINDFRGEVEKELENPRSPESVENNWDNVISQSLTGKPYYTNKPYRPSAPLADDTNANAFYNVTNQGDFESDMKLVLPKVQP